MLTLADDGLIYKTASDISTVTAVQEQLEKMSHWWSKSRRISMRCRLLSKKKRGVDGKSWMGQAELKQVRDWEKRPFEFKPYYKTLLSENLGTHCREWPAGKTNAEVQMLVEANSKTS